MSSHSLFMRCVPALVLAVSWLSAPEALAQDGSEEAAYASRAVQNRHYQGTNELSLLVGILPLDAFTKGFTLGGSYTLHISDSWAWEVAQFLHSFPFDTDLRAKLEAIEPDGLEPTPFEIVENLLTTNIVFKPVYWKGALLNDTIIHGEIMFVLGGGLGWFTRSRRVAVDYGMILRVYLARWLSVRLDVRHHIFFSDSITNLDVQHELLTQLGLSAQF